MEWIRGKLRAVRTLATQARHFSNWKEVYGAFRRGQPLPTLELRGGLTLQHGPADDIWSLFHEIFVERCYATPDFYVPQKEHCVLDCGANIGTFALYLQSVAPGIRVHCFEPASDTRSRLERNIKANHLETQVTIHPCAVFDHEGELELPKATFAGSASVFGENTTGDAVEKVRCITLAQAIELCKTSHVDLLKVDVEGAELEILENADTVSPPLWPRIQRVVMEYHEAIRPGCRERIAKLLERHYSKVKSWPVTPSGELGILQASR